MRDQQQAVGAEAKEEPLYKRLEFPRLFMMLSLVRRFAGPEARQTLGLSDFEWRIMAQVGDRAPMSLNDLAAASTHDKGQLSRGVKRLVEAGLLLRESRRGERGVFISPTAEGRKVFDRLVQLAIDQNEALMQGLTSDQRAAFGKILEQLEANVLARLAALQDSRDQPEAA